MPNLIELTRDIVLIVTGIIGSAFAIFKYKRSREAEAVLQLELTLNVHPVSAKNLVDVAIKIRNVGTAAAYINPQDLESAVLMVRKIPCTVNGNLRWEDLESQALIDDVKYMDIYDEDSDDDDSDGPIIFEPKAVDTYSVFFLTDYSGPIWIRAQFFDKEAFKWLVDGLFVLPDPGTPAPIEQQSFTRARA